MSSNTAAMYSCHHPILSSYQTRYEALPPHRLRASTITQDVNTQWHRDAQRMPGLHATHNFQPPIFSREYSYIWDDVQNDWAMAAREQELACQLQVERSPNYEQHTRDKKCKRVSFDTERGRRVSTDGKRSRHESVDREPRGRTSTDRKHARHESIDRERRGRVSLDRPQEHPAFIDCERLHHASVDHEGQLRESLNHERERRASVDRKQQRRESVDRERECRASMNWRHDRERDMSIGRHAQYGSGSRAVLRPPVCAVSFKPPTTGPQSRHRKSESESVVILNPPICTVSSKPPATHAQFRHHKSDPESMTFPRPPICAVSFKPPTTGPQSRHPRRSSFDHATGHDHSGEHQHPVCVLSPTALAPQIHLPPRQRKRTASVEAVRRLRFLSPEVPPLEKSKLSGLTRFNPFNKLRPATMSTSQKIRRKTAGRA